MPLIDTMTLNGAAISQQIRGSITDAQIQTTTGQVSQFSFTVVDEGWRYLDAGLFELGTSVSIGDYSLHIAARSSADVSGVEALKLDCRPNSVRALKNRRGTRVMSNVSPSDFVAVECRAVGANYVVQPSGRRKNVSRDVPAKGQQETTTPPSSWTTFSRLASEEGFVTFEAANIIYFGRPTWLQQWARNNYGDLTVVYGAGENNPNGLLGIPDVHETLDDPKKTADGSLRGSMRTQVFVPRGIVYQGMSRLSISMMISSVTIDAMDDGAPIDFQAEIPINPTPNPPQ